MAEDDGEMPMVGSFNPWAYFRLGQAKPIYMNGRDHVAGQEGIMRFVDHQESNSYYEYSDICDMLDAIRDMHLRAGYPGPPKDKPLVNIAMVALSERRRELPAGQRASVVAPEAEVRQIEHRAWEAAREPKLEAARAEAALEFIAEHDHGVVAMTEDSAFALGRKVPASKKMLR